MESTTGYTFPVQNGGIFYFPWNKARRLHQRHNNGNKRKMYVESGIPLKHYYEKVQQSCKSARTVNKHKTHRPAKLGLLLQHECGIG